QGTPQSQADPERAGQGVAGPRGHPRGPTCGSLATSAPASVFSSGSGCQTAGSNRTGNCTPELCPPSRKSVRLKSGKGSVNSSPPTRADGPGDAPCHGTPGDRPGAGLPTGAGWVAESSVGHEQSVKPRVTVN